MWRNVQGTLFLFTIQIFTLLSVYHRCYWNKMCPFSWPCLNHVVWKHALATFCYNWSSDFVIVITFHSFIHLFIQPFIHSFIHAHCAWTRTHAGMVMPISLSYCSPEPQDWFWWSVKVLHLYYDIRGHTKLILPNFQSGNGTNFSPGYPCPCYATNALHHLISLLHCWIKRLASTCS